MIQLGRMHLGRRRTVTRPRSRLYRLAIALSMGVALLTMTSSPAFARTEASGSVQCSFSAKLSFSPSLTKSGGGTTRSSIRASLSGCTTDDVAHVLHLALTHGAFTGTFVRPPLACRTLSSTDAPVSGNIRWSTRRVGTRGVALRPTTVTNNVTSISFPGFATLAINVPSTLASGCAQRRGVRSTTVTGTIVLGPLCGSGSAPFTIYRTGAGPFCGPDDRPLSIAAGSDGALWFSTNTGSIGRMTTSGAETFYPVGPVDDVIAGPDGALWFTTISDGFNAIGRITTSGAVSYYTAAGLSPSDLTVGPDGAIWFANAAGGVFGGDFIGRITTSGAITINTGTRIYDAFDMTFGSDGALWFTMLTRDSIGRVTTSGVVSYYTAPTIGGPTGIAAGPDGALWFTNGGFNASTPTDHGRNTIGRITTSGAVTSFASPLISGPSNITTGPDGALWFTNYSNANSIGRITTSGVVTSYTDPSILDPYAITAGPDGALWFTDIGNSTIGRVTTP